MHSDVTMIGRYTRRDEESQCLVNILLKNLHQSITFASISSFGRLKSDEHRVCELQQSGTASLDLSSVYLTSHMIMPPRPFQFLHNVLSDQNWNWGRPGNV